eukprot:CAMPEP_0113943892 /NCGR_PEP_ID=MMETSP1339-20121228/29267_1 /TAXON_ID=94617 /ORGANISM="Fibrocapsa japonica" /LENGTH=191 /DNA_ID=CAMNT_0000948879 /DNA_START=143 /DNA_END=718 /DNA_ORIENTATION=+ /assembly_acc=CAM_ASM_000762
MVAGNFEVLAGEFEPILVTVSDSSGEFLFQAVSEPEAVFSLTANDRGPFTLCLWNGPTADFLNRMPKDKGAAIKPFVGDGVKRTLGFAFRVATSLQEGEQEEEEQKEDAYADIEEDMEQVLIQLEELVEYTRTMQDHQQYMRQREEKHRDTTESTCERVLYWTAAELVVLVSLGFWQVAYIRKFFEVKRSI